MATIILILIGLGFGYIVYKEATKNKKVDKRPTQDNPEHEGSGGAAPKNPSPDNDHTDYKDQ